MNICLITALVIIDIQDEDVTFSSHLGLSNITLCPWHHRIGELRGLKNDPNEMRVKIGHEPESVLKLLAVGLDYNLYYIIDNCFALNKRFSNEETF